VLAIVAAIVALAAILGIGTHTLMLWLFLMFMALHFALDDVLWFPGRRARQ
jgi:hypothetical protein